MRIVKVNKDSIANILSDLLKRSPTNYGDFQDKVDAIIKNVRDNGDKAVFDYTAQFDKAEINADNILVTEEEIKEYLAGNLCRCSGYEGQLRGILDFLEYKKNKDGGAE